MPHFRVDDNFHAHRKVAKLGVDGIDAIGLWTLAGSWSADQLTDGWVPEYVAARLDPGYEKRALKLVQVGLWEEAERDGERGWLFHGWSEPGRNLSAEQVQAERAATAERQRRFRNRVKGTEDRNGVTNASVTDPRNGRVTDPFPFPSLPSIKDSSSSADADDGSAAQKPKPRRAKRDTAEGFDEFWQAYPRKVGKVAAEKAYAKAIAAGIEPKLILDGARRYATSVHGKDADHIKHPQGWLNDGRYADDLISGTQPPAAPQPPKPTWCGQCDETTRLTEFEGRPYRCPRCHPLTQKATAR